MSTSTVSATTPILARHRKLASVLAEHELDALVLNPGPSLGYMTGLEFHLMERPVVAVFPAAGTPVLVLPELEQAKLSGLPFEMEAFTYDENPANWSKAFWHAAEASGINGRRVGVEPRWMRVLELRYLEGGAPEATFVSGEDAVAALRMCKDEQEIAHMQTATQIAQDALRATLPALQPGVTERAIAAELIQQLLRAGSDPHLPFFPIVCFGPNCANPHAVPSDRPLKEGDLILVDWGAGFQGYFSDLTRMFSRGTPDPELARITDIVGRANAAGRAAAGPGAACADIDRAARGVIEDEGYGPYFFHRTGHGLGLETHEEPYIRGDNTQVLEPGMTFTVEPGIYLEGRGGARIEDDMVITPGGARSLSDMPRELVVL